MKTFIFTTLILLSGRLLAQCVIYDSNGGPAKFRQDALGQMLQGQRSCPKDIQGLRRLLGRYGLQTKATMVANRGFHERRSGSYSFFETVVSQKQSGLSVQEGQFFFGHFTARRNNQLVLNQSPERGNLMIELIVWDSQLQIYNFYELIGNGASGSWFYRGNSRDILADNAALKLQLNPNEPVFGQRLRCSACHVSGGPIMKELQAPHSDWWRQQMPLDLTAFSLDADVKQIMTTIQDASYLAKVTRIGVHALRKSPTLNGFKAKMGLRRLLRPVFCTTEINLASDIMSSAANIAVPAAAYVSPLLVGQKYLAANRVIYEQTLAQLGAKFAGTARADSQYAWHVPVKGYSDLLAIKDLVQRQIIDLETVADILAIDFTRPLFSQARCRLLRLVPNELTPDWRALFVARLKQARSASATELHAFLTEAKFDRRYHAQQGQLHLQKLQESFNSAVGMSQALKHLQTLRSSVYFDEISHNPRGQILEPGFRVIFPQW